VESFLGKRQRRRNGKKEERKEENVCANPFGRLAALIAEADSVQGSRRAHRQKFRSFALAGLYTDLYSLEPGPQT